MAELLVRMVDKVNPNDYDLNLKCFKRGDVIDVHEDGWPWSAAEVLNPEWKIMYFPNGTMSAAESYLVPELPTGPDDLSTKRLRGFYFDLDSALPGTHFPGGDTAMLAYKVEKSPLPDTDVFE